MSATGSDALDPVIVDAALVPGHDGLAEITVVVRYPNGAERALTLPYETVAPALDRAAIATMDELLGRPWTCLLPAST